MGIVLRSQRSHRIKHFLTMELTIFILIGRAGGNCFYHPMELIISVPIQRQMTNYSNTFHTESNYGMIFFAVAMLFNLLG